MHEGDLGPGGELVEHEPLQVGRAGRESGGIGDRLLRLSVGLEDVEDLWADLDRALA